MENKSSSRTQKTKTGYLVHIANELIQKRIFTIPKVYLQNPSEEYSSEYILRLNNNRLLLTKTSDSQMYYLLNLAANQENFDFILSFLKEDDFKIKKVSDKNLSLKKQNKSFVRRLLTHIKKRGPSPQLNEVLSLTNENREVQYLYSNFDTIDHLPELILSTDQFKTFNACQFLVHEKGNLYCDSYLSKNGIDKKKSTVQVESFNSINSIIKKSKSKQFNQTQILKDDIEILGTFLAKNFDFKNHSIILIISRNDFLPLTKEEKVAFDEYCLKLCPLLSYILERAQIAKKSQSINLALLNYTDPIAILTSKDQILFQNEVFTEEHFYDYLSGNGKFTTFKISREHTLVTHVSDNAKITTDISHFQRISLLGELLNTLRHELSNPLFGLKLSSDLLASESDDLEIKETLNDISSSADRCQTIIKNFTYLYSDEEVKDLVNISKLINETYILTKSESRQIKKNVEFIDFSDEDYLLTINPTWLSQIIFNLVINSSQAIKTLTDDLKSHEISIIVTKNEKFISFAISDSGPGIRKEIQEKLFEPFYTTKSNGTGLGLSISRNLAKKLGGKLSYVHAKDAGALFQLDVPYNKESSP
ncbi:MAG: HAMP domain-containing histidine kinase [Bacteriovoracaceae bacterium]|jgi:two-component system, NtrC family, sensor kinase|nr:HAMP domain-containing histidine kinase [Bacteriovoracaceae bacterium]